jgi:hypothetical protein
MGVLMLKQVVCVITTFVTSLIKGPRPCVVTGLQKNNSSVVEIKCCNIK